LADGSKKREEEEEEQRTENKGLRKQDVQISAEGT
jgi:hypothetical protein